MLKYFIAACFCVILVSGAAAQGVDSAIVHPITVDPPSTLTLYAGPLMVPSALVALGVGLEVEFPYAPYASLMTQAGSGFSVYKDLYQTEFTIIPGVAIGPRWYTKTIKKQDFLETGIDLFAILNSRGNHAGAFGLNLGVGHLFTISPDAKILIRMKGHMGMAAGSGGHPSAGGYVLYDIHIGWMLKL